ncbi:MAG: DEAD/DEAH box helicase, partial [Lachnospiraceae bacterium]|nr:DEAD/DEAH box helicase [Lachnospiraceae bacterium]
MVKEFKTVKDSDFEVPEHLRGIMRKYQKVGYKWLRTLDAYGFGGILADDMGLGKTLQLISVLSAHKGEGGTGTALIICPASLVFNWQEECRRFAPELTVCLVVGSQPERAHKIRRYRDYDVLITSYDLLKRDIVEYEDCSFAYQVLDEAQYIKNHSTAASKAVKIIRSRTRYALTGTPIENRLSELWSIFDYLMPGFLYGYDTFKKELEKPITRGMEEEATARLKKMVSPFILRRLKQQVLKDLPDKLEETRYARLEEKQQKLYDGQVLRMRDMLRSQTEENFRRNKIEILAELMKIRQICCDPSLCLEDYDGGSAKREACLDLIRSAMEGEHKMLVFSQFTSMLELLEQDLDAQGIAHYKITGATPKETRVELVRRFNEDDTPVFLISLKAGGTGLNLTGADVVIHYDPWWNLAVQNQATDRAHRIGQTKVVSVYKLIVKDSIEEKILHMQEAKQNLADEILSGETGGLASLSREELLQLIEG